MRCELAKELILTDYSDGQLKGVKLTQMEAHLVKCASCRAFAAQVKANVIQPFEQLAVQRPDPFVWQRIKNRIEEENTTSSLAISTTDIIRNFFYTFKPAIASLCVAFILGVCVFSFYGPQMTLGKSKDQKSKDSYLAYVIGGETQSSSDSVSGEIERYFL